MVALLGTVTVNPVAGIGDVGTNTDTIGSPVTCLMSSMPSPVTKPIDQIPFRGYSIATIRRHWISFSVNAKSVTCLTEEYTLRISGKRFTIDSP